MMAGGIKRCFVLLVGAGMFLAGSSFAQERARSDADFDYIQHPPAGAFTRELPEIRRQRNLERFSQEQELASRRVRENPSKAASHFIESLQDESDKYDPGLTLYQVRALIQNFYLVGYVNLRQMIDESARLLSDIHHRSQDHPVLWVKEDLLGVDDSKRTQIGLLVEFLIGMGEAVGAEFLGDEALSALEEVVGNTMEHYSDKAIAGIAKMPGYEASKCLQRILRNNLYDSRSTELSVVDFQFMDRLEFDQKQALIVLLLAARGEKELVRSFYSIGRGSKIALNTSADYLSRVGVYAPTPYPNEMIYRGIGIGAVVAQHVLFLMISPSRNLAALNSSDDVILLGGKLGRAEEALLTGNNLVRSSSRMGRNPYPGVRGIPIQPQPSPWQPTAFGGSGSVMGGPAKGTEVILKSKPVTQISSSVPKINVSPVQANVSTGPIAKVELSSLDALKTPAVLPSLYRANLIPRHREFVHPDELAEEHAVIGIPGAIENAEKKKGGARRTKLKRIDRKGEGSAKYYQGKKYIPVEGTPYWRIQDDPYETLFESTRTGEMIPVLHGTFYPNEDIEFPFDGYVVLANLRNIPRFISELYHSLVKNPSQSFDDIINYLIHLHQISKAAENTFEPARDIAHKTKLILEEAAEDISSRVHELGFQMMPIETDRDLFLVLVTARQLFQDEEQADLFLGKTISTMWVGIEDLYLEYFVPHTKKWAAVQPFVPWVAGEGIPLYVRSNNDYTFISDAYRELDEGNSDPIHALEDFFRELERHYLRSFEWHHGAINWLDDVIRSPRFRLVLVAFENMHRSIAGLPKLREGVIARTTFQNFMRKVLHVEKEEAAQLFLILTDRHVLGRGEEWQQFVDRVRSRWRLWVFQHDARLDYTKTKKLGVADSKKSVSLGSKFQKELKPFPRIQKDQGTVLWDTTERNHSLRGPQMGRWVYIHKGGPTVVLRRTLTPFLVSSWEEITPEVGEKVLLERNDIVLLDPYRRIGWKFRLIGPARYDFFWLGHSSLEQAAVRRLYDVRLGAEEANSLLSEDYPRPLLVGGAKLIPPEKVPDLIPVSEDTEVTRVLPFGKKHQEQLKPYFNIGQTHGYAVEETNRARYRTWKTRWWYVNTPGRTTTIVRQGVEVINQLKEPIVLQDGDLLCLSPRRHVFYQFIDGDFFLVHRDPVEIVRPVTDLYDARNAGATPLLKKGWRTVDKTGLPSVLEAYSSWSIQGFVRIGRRYQQEELGGYLNTLKMEHGIVFQVLVEEESQWFYLDLSGGRSSLVRQDNEIEPNLVIPTRLDDGDVIYLNPRKDDGILIQLIEGEFHLILRP